jgi:hypothetical protein
MKTRFVLVMAIVLVFSISAWSQRSGEGQRSSEQRSGEMQRSDQSQNQPRANQGRIPAPPPQRVQGAKLEPERRDGGRLNNTPHVSNDRWYGHDKPNDKRYHLDRPYAHGRFDRFGPSYRYNLIRMDQNLRRFWLPGGYYFDISAWDWPLCMDWCWSCGGDDFVIYEDPDHPGWYLLYNLHLGMFVHVMYMGM